MMVHQFMLSVASKSKYPKVRSQEPSFNFLIALRTIAQPMDSKNKILRMGAVTGGLKIGVLISFLDNNAQDSKHVGLRFKVDS